MATYNGVNYLKWAPASGIPKLVEQAILGGKLRRMYDSFTLTQDLAQNDIINLGSPLPEGAVLVDARLKCPAMGGSCALDFGFTASTELPVGDVGVGGTVDQAADPTAFFNAAVVSSAYNKRAADDTVGAGHAGDFYGKTVAGPGCQPQIKCEVASSGATGNKVEVEIWYIVE